MISAQTRLGRHQENPRHQATATARAAIKEANSDILCNLGVIFSTPSETNERRLLALTNCRWAKMFATSRRSVILSAAVAGAALGLDGSLAIAAPKRVRQTRDPAQGFVRYKVGDAECTALYDGTWEKAHDPADFSNPNVG